MKDFIRRVVRRLANIPYVGRLVRMGVAIWRGPVLLDRVAGLEQTYTTQLPTLLDRVAGLEQTYTTQLPTLLDRVAGLEQTYTTQLPTLLDRVAGLEQTYTTQLPTLLDRVAGLEQTYTTQLPTLLDRVAEINHRQVAMDADHENLVKSVPVALRKLRREAEELRQALATQAAGAQQGAEELRQALATQAAGAQQGAEELRQALATQAAGAQQGAEELRQALATQAAGAQQGAEELRQALATQAAGAQQGAEELRQALVNLTSSVTYLLGRVEFVRRELMFEMRYGAASTGGQSDTTLEAQSQILSPEKLRVARAGQLRLNLGCGHIPLNGYINVDRRTLPGVDIVAEAGNLPLEKEEVVEIFAAHLLEHFPQEQLRRELLPYWFELLKPGGEFRVVVPDAETMTREYSNGRYPYDDLREVMYGAQDYEGDFHFNMFTPAALQQLLKETGFVDIEVVATGRRNGKCFECDLRAFRPCS